MCGITGYVDLAGEPPDLELVARMVDLLRHRGPDGDGIRALAQGPPGPTVVFGHRRLAIIDLTSAADQPLANEDGSVVVTFNGEIYNFRELRRELEARGHVFSSSSDTEVIVHAYETYGDAFVERLDGMFAFALWDGRQRRLVLARDRVGKKPLYYAWDGRQLTFGSEIGSVRVCPWVDDAVDWERLPELLGFGYVPWPRTCYRGIRQVPPASMLVLDGERLSEPRSYWSLQYSTRREGRRVDRLEVEARTLELLREAVERRLVAEVPVGVLLSGGLDSSAIVALMASLGVPIRTFTAGVADEASYDERPFARKIAERFGTSHTEITVRADAWAMLERVLWFHGQPFGDSSALPTYLIAEAARREVTVAITGDGGDETFAGYERFAGALLAERSPAALQRAVHRLIPVLPRSSAYFGLRRRLDRFAGRAGAPPEERYLDWVSLRGGSPGLRPELLGRGNSTGWADSFFTTIHEAGDVPLLHRLLHANLRTYLHDDLLVKTDRMTMAHSLEARSPFLDTGLMEFVASLPADTKARSFSPKRLLRSAVKGLLPPDIVRRRKHGFGVPVGRWLRTELRVPFQELVLASDARSKDALDQEVVRAIFRRHVEGVDELGGELWTILCLETWLRSLERPQPSEPPAASVVLEGESLEP